MNGLREQQRMQIASWTLAYPWQRLTIFRLQQPATCLVTCGSRAQSEMDLGLFAFTKWRLMEFLAWNIFKNLSRTL